jgi:hypothetical protein
MSLPLTLVGALLLLSAGSVPVHASSRPLRTSASISGGDHPRSADASSSPSSSFELLEKEKTSLLGPASDLVTHLPGYGAPPHPQDSGFLDASAAVGGGGLYTSRIQLTPIACESARPGSNPWPIK